MRILYFTIYGALQSWGECSSWNVRESAEWPTKSGIAGMISAALGYEYNDVRIGELCNCISVGFKTKKEYSPQLNDFQTVNYYGGLLANGKRENRLDQKTRESWCKPAETEQNSLTPLVPKEKRNQTKYFTITPFLFQ